MNGLLGFAGGGLNSRVTPGWTLIATTTSFTLLFSANSTDVGAEQTVEREKKSAVTNTKTVETLINIICVCPLQRSEMRSKTEKCVKLCSSRG